jgi:hypothetical protein
MIKEDILKGRCSSNNNRNLERAENVSTVLFGVTIYILSLPKNYYKRTKGSNIYIYFGNSY